LEIDIMNPSPCFTVAVATILALGLPSAAQEPAKPAETKVVLRVSREFLKKLAGARFEKDQPIDSNADGVAVSGTAHVAGEVDVKLRESATESEFDLHISGNITTQLTASRRPVVVFAHGNAPFNAIRRVGFDGTKFSGQPVCVSVANRFCLDGIGSFRPGIAGAVTRGLARPFVRRGLRDGDRQADDEIRTQVAGGVQDATDRMVDSLNTIEPTLIDARQYLAEVAGKQQYPLVPYHAATKHHLLISIDVPGRVIAKLPGLEHKDRAPLELWIAKRHDLLGEFVLEVGLVVLADNWKKNAKKIGVEILRKNPELVQVFGKEIQAEAHILHTGDWHVITLTPTIKGQPVIELP
jgi:hypothetical protein